MTDTIKITNAAGDVFPYTLVQGSPLPWTYGQVLSTPFRLSGIPTPQDNQLVSRFPYLWFKGLGWISQYRSTGRGVSGLRDADADTSGNILTLPHLQQSVANPAPYNYYGSASDTNLSHWFSFAGELIGIFQDIGGSGAFRSIGSRLFQGASDTWTSGSFIGISGSYINWVESYDGTTHKGSAYVLFGHENGAYPVALEDGEYRVRTQSTVTGSWLDTAAQPGGSALYIDTTPPIAYAKVPNNGGYPHAILLDAPTAGRNDLIAVIYEEAAASGGSIDQTRIYHTPDVGANWTNTGNVPGKPRGKAMWVDPYTAGFPVAPVISTTEGLYLITPATPLVSPILVDELGLGGGDDAGFMAKGPDGSLYISTNSGDILRVSVTGIGSFDINNIGPVTSVPGDGDGIAASRQGPVTWMVSSTKFLYVAMQGATYSHIVRFKYETQAWHSFFLHSDNTNKIYRMALSGRDDGTQRLHIAMGTGLYPGSGIDLTMFEKPDDPIATSGAAVEASGFVQFPSDDMGDPHTTAGVYQSLMEADGLTSTTAGEYINYKTGSDTATWGTDDRGNFLSTETTITFASGSGISANTIKNQLTLYRDSGDTSQTPLVKSFEMRAVNAQDALRVVTLPIDLTATSSFNNRSVSQLIAELETFFKAATQVTIEASNVGTWKAKVLSPPQFDLRINSADNQQQLGLLSGTALVSFTQLIEGI